jgi:hypothetical protein
MIRWRGTIIVLIANAFIAKAGISQGRVVSVFAGTDGSAQITFADGQKTTIPRERGQVSISEAHIASDGTVGWLAEYHLDGVSYPVAKTLIIWRAGEIINRIPAEQVFYSWTFYASGKQVTYHDGPLHGEQQSHCELHEAGSGRTIARWDGDLESKGNRPAWTRDLSH